MIDQPDASDKIYKRFNSEIENIYSGLSAYYDRYQSSDTNEPSDVIARIISDNYYIPENIVNEDYQYEKKRQEENKISIPDIPTYKMRFAIEEGSWIVFLRENLRTLLKEHFAKLLQLEELIWETAAGKKEDYAYYLLELNEIGENWILPVVEIWKQSHDYGDITEFAPFMISSYHQTPISRGIIMYEGGKRLFDSKISKLADIKQFRGESHWFERGSQIIESIEKHQDQNSNSEIYHILVIVIALLQKELTLKRLTRKNDALAKNSEFKTIWENYNPSHLDQREEFADYVIKKLYLRAEEDPIDAGSALIKELLENIINPENKIKHIQEKFKIMVIKENNDLINEIQKSLPIILTEVRREELRASHNNSKMESIDHFPIWDAFHDNLSRLDRIAEKDRSFDLMKKSVKSVYQFLIDKKIESETASKEIVKSFADCKNLNQHEHERIVLNLKLIQEIYEKRSKSMKKLDKAFQHILIQEFLRVRANPH